VGTGTPATSGINCPLEFADRYEHGLSQDGITPVTIKRNSSAKSDVQVMQKTDNALFLPLDMVSRKPMMARINAIGANGQSTARRIDDHKCFGNRPSLGGESG
jgi:hypothetical protein